MNRIICSLLIIIPLVLFAQPAKWEITIGEPNKNERPSDIIEMYDKGYLMSAAVEQINNNGWHIKLDVKGGILYDKVMTHDHTNMNILSLKEGNGGEVITCGAVFYDDNTWPFVNKFDSCGERLWCKHFPGESMESNGFACDIEFTTNNDILILTSYYSWELTSSMIYMICIDQDGNELWKRPYSSKEQYPLMEDPYGWDLISHNDEYYIAGECYYAYPEDPNHVFLRPLFVGINSHFEEKWVMPFMALDSIFGEALSIYPISDSLLVGVGYRFLEGFNKNSIIMFINTQGDEVDMAQIDNSSILPTIDFNIIEQLYQINDSTFLSPVYMGIEGEERYGEIVYNITGDVLNASNRGIYKSRFASTKTCDNEFLISLSVIVGGNNRDILLYKIDENLDPVPFDTTQQVYDSLCPHTIQSGEMDLTNCLVITSIEDWPTPDEYYESIRWIPVKAYPNPVTEGKLTLEFENTEHHQHMELRCYDDFGRQIHSQLIYKGQQDTDVDVSGWSPGIYVAVVFSNGEARGKAKFVVSH